MRYRLAIFDFDGTLADSFDWFLGAYDQVAGELGFRRVPAEEVASLRGVHARDILRRLEVPTWKMPQAAARMRALQARDIDRIGLFPGVAEMLEGLAARDVALAVVTSNAEANVRRVLGPDHARRIAHYACGAPLFGKRSRLRRVLRAARVPPAEAFAIGDELRDLEAARAEGIAFGAVSWGYGAPEALRGAGPTEVFAEPADILARLG
jgi:phosphoglycolate phosphatase